MSSSGQQDEIMERIKEQQKNIASKKKLLRDTEHELESIAADMNHPEAKKLADGISNLCIVMGNLYDHVEGLWVAGLIGQKQLQILNDALMLVPQIAENKAAMDFLDKAAIDYEKKFASVKLNQETS